MSSRDKLIPYMVEYDKQFSDAGEVRWLPYLMYFHPQNYRSSTVNTDKSGFRYSENGPKKCSIADHVGIESVRLIAGSSTVFGIGASADQWTLASCLSKHDTRPEPWLNFGGRSFNSTQEMLLLLLYRHLLPTVEEIVLFSGFNNLGLARMPQEKRLEHGAFFNCNQFFANLTATGNKPSKMKQLLLDSQRTFKSESIPSIEEQLLFASNLTLRHLDIWRVIANDLGAKLTFVLQPLANWVRPQGCIEEEALFAELDQRGKFSELYGDILQQDVCSEYAAQLKLGADNMGVNFINLSPVLTASIEKYQWLFVDRIHFTDHGHDYVARKLLDIL